MLFRVVDSKTFEIYYIGHTEKECQDFIDKNNLDYVFIERIR